MIIDKKDLANLLRRFVEGTVSDWEFDDFISSPSESLFLEGIRKEVINVPRNYPPEDPATYASSAGMARIISIADKLDPPLI